MLRTVNASCASVVLLLRFSDTTVGVAMCKSPGQRNPWPLSSPSSWSLPSSDLCPRLWSLRSARRSKEMNDLSAITSSLRFLLCLPSYRFRLTFCCICLFRRLSDVIWRLIWCHFEMSCEFSVLRSGCQGHDLVVQIERCVFTRIQIFLVNKKIFDTLIHFHLHFGFILMKGNSSWGVKSFEIPPDLTVGSWWKGLCPSFTAAHRDSAGQQ